MSFHPSRLLILLAAVLALAGCETVPKHKTAPAAHPAAAPAPVPAKPTPSTAPAQAAVPAPPQTAATSMNWLKPARWRDLPGWRADNLEAAWPAFMRSCHMLDQQTAWQAVCAAAARLHRPGSKAIRTFFTDRFKVYQIRQRDGHADGLITGYYEPLLHGSLKPTAKYRYPLYAPPDDLLTIDLGDVYPELKNLRLRGRLDGKKVVPYFTRREIDAGKAPVKGKEIAWVDDPVELFFLQVQGSGRIRLQDGSMLRVGYADQNGYPYRSIGKWLIEHGELAPSQASMQGIEDWALKHPDRLPKLLAENPSYIFFRVLPNNSAGPIGSLGVPLTPGRSIAVDPSAMPLGAPVWLATTQPNSKRPLDRLVLAQDTGSAIQGDVRADLFWGFGKLAGKRAGAMKQAGRMWLLLPKDYSLATAAGPVPHSGL